MYADLSLSERRVQYSVLKAKKIFSCRNANRNDKYSFLHDKSVIQRFKILEVNNKIQSGPWISTSEIPVRKMKLKRDLQSLLFLECAIDRLLKIT